MIARERVSAEVAVFCPGSDTQHFWHILFVRSESPGQACTKGEAIITQGHEYQESDH